MFSYKQKKSYIYFYFFYSKSKFIILFYAFLLGADNLFTLHL
jgi:hypothetical protein